MSITAGQAPLYVPMLKGRLGEFNALEMMNARTRNAIYPLIEVVPDIEVAPGPLMRRFADLAVKWEEGPLMLDGFHLAPRLGSGVSALRFVTDAARGLVQAVPVIRLTESEAARRDAAAVASDDGNGIAIRLTGEDLSADIDREVHGLIEAVGVPLRKVDLVVDLGLIDTQAAVSRVSRLADDLLAGLSQITGFRTVVVASGAFPPDLRDVTPWNVTEKDRHDAAMWEGLREREPARMPVFGDYAIAHPRMIPPSSGWPSPQLRYTVAGRWLVLRGTRNDLRSSAQFYDICEQICRHPEFSGADLGEADHRIANPGLHGPGNATTWRSIGTAHHADFVISRLMEDQIPD